LLQQTEGIAALLFGLFADAPVGLVLLDPELRYVLVNDALAELNGVPASAHVGRRPEEVVPELAPKLIPVMKRALSGVPVVNFEVDEEIAARPGPRTTLESFYPLRDADGRVAGIGGVIVDITLRKDAQRARDDALALLDTLFETAPVGLSLWDRELRFQRVNTALARSNGMTPEAHVGELIEDVLPGLAAELTGPLQQVLERGEVVLNAGVSGDTPAAPGIRRHWQVSYYPVHDGEGQVISAGAVWHEVTDLRHARDSERYLRELLGEERAVLHEVISRAPAGIVLLWGPDDRVRFANERFREIAMLDDVDPTGHTFRDILPDLWPIAEPLLTEVRGGRPVARDNFAIPVRDPEREDAFRGRRFMTFTLDPVLAPGAEQAGILLVVMETTAQVRRQAELEDELREERRITGTLQRALLPRTLPAIPGASIAARYEAAGTRFDVGGDFYDAFEIPGRGWIVVVGDVCGKGPEAAALTAMARYTLRAEAAHADSPGTLLGLLSEEMLRREAELAEHDDVARFATAACAWAQASPEGLHLRVVSAGQPDPLLLRADGSVDRVAPAGPPCGAFPDITYADREELLKSGESLVLYTDGVLDAGAPLNQLRISELADALGGRPPGGAQDVADFVAQLVAGVGGDEPRDDYAVMVLAAD
jgi:PAS domain S-box-containing protein